MSGQGDLACVYAALILADDDVKVTAEKLESILKAANVEVEAYWPGMFAKALEHMDIRQLVTNLSLNTAATSGSHQEKPEEPKQASNKEDHQEVSSDEDTDDENGFLGLFDD